MAQWNETDQNEILSIIFRTKFAY